MRTWIDHPGSKRIGSGDWGPDDLAGENFLPAVYNAVQEVGGPMLLTLLVYAYARGCYSSDQIAELCRDEANARYICARRFPQAEAIRAFRRAHKADVQHALARLIEQCSNRVPAAEASRRILKAIQLDSILLDF